MTQRPASRPVPADELARIAADAAHAGARAIDAELAAARAAGHALDRRTKSGPADFVTAADLASERAILAALGAARPADDVLAEESGDHPGGRADDTGRAPLRWLVDPIDGTLNFVHGRADFAISIGVEPVPPDSTTRPGPPAGQDAIAGAVLQPGLGRLFAAGATPLAELNAAPLQVSKCERLADALVGVGYPQGRPARLRAHTWLGSLLSSLRDYRRIGSAACDLVNVATGVQDGYLAFGVKPWDIGAGFALVRAAGGEAGWAATASGRDVAVAGTAAVYAGLVELVAECEV